MSGGTTAFTIGATAATATTAATAGTAITVGTVMGAVGAMGSLIGGIQSMGAGGDQSAAALAGADLRGKEIARQASARAVQEKSRYKDVTRRQKLAYMKSGVTLEGSPLLVMEETRMMGEANVDEILSAGASGVSTALIEGEQKASQYEAQGRQALVGGITNSATGAYNVLKEFKK